MGKRKDSFRKYLRTQGSIWLIVALIASQLPITILAAPPEAVVGLDDLILDENELYEEADIATSDNARAMKGNTATPDNWVVVTSMTELSNAFAAYAHRADYTIAVELSYDAIVDVSYSPPIKAKLVIRPDDGQSKLTFIGSAENMVLENGKLDLVSEELGSMTVTRGTCNFWGSVDSLTISGGIVEIFPDSKADSINVTAGGLLILQGSANTLTLDNGGIVRLKSGNEIRNMTMLNGFLETGIGLDNGQLKITGEFVYYNGSLKVSVNGLMGDGQILTDPESVGSIINKSSSTIKIYLGNATDDPVELSPDGKIENGSVSYLLRFQAPAGAAATWNGIPSTSEWRIEAGDEVEIDITVPDRHLYHECLVNQNDKGGNEVPAQVRSMGRNQKTVSFQMPECSATATLRLWHGDDVDAVNRMIKDNGLKAPIDDPSHWEGSGSLAEPGFATWNYPANPARLTGLQLADRDLTGILDVSGMTELKELDCKGNRLSALIGLDKLDGLTSLDFTGNPLSVFTAKGGDTMHIRQTHGGTVSMTAYDVTNDRVTLTANPSTAGAGYGFRGWLGLPDGQNLLTDTESVDFRLDEDMTITPLWNPGTDAGLSELSVAEAAISPAFDPLAPDQKEYTASVAYETSNVTVTAAPYDPQAAVTGAGSRDLQVGENVISVTAASEDGKAANTYTLRITRRENTGTPEPEPTPTPTPDPEPTPQPQPDRSSGSSDGSSGGSALAAPHLLHGTWQWTSDGCWMFYLTDGTYAKNRWGIVGGLWYCFDAEGKMRTGWYYDPAYLSWFWLEPTGAMATGWREIDGKWYYFIPASGTPGAETGTGAMGSMVTDRLIDGWYVDKNGVWDGK